MYVCELNYGWGLMEEIKQGWNAKYKWFPKQNCPSKILRGICLVIKNRQQHKTFPVMLAEWQVISLFFDLVLVCCLIWPPLPPLPQPLSQHCQAQ